MDTPQENQGEPVAPEKSAKTNEPVTKKQPVAAKGPIEEDQTVATKEPATEDQTGAKQQTVEAEQQTVEAEQSITENQEKPQRHNKIFKIREELPSHHKTLLSLGCVVLVLLLWHMFSTGENRVPRMILPSPGEVWDAFGPLHSKMELTTSISKSLKRVSLGFLIAATLAIPLGILMGTFPKIDSFFEPLTLFGGYVPVVTLVPLTLTWWGLGWQQKIGFLTIGIFVFLLPMIVKTVKDIDTVYLNTGYTLGANRWQTIWHIIIPMAKSQIFGHCRFLYGIGWAYIILAEYTDLSAGGLGTIIISANRVSATDRVFAVLIVIVVIAILVDTALKHLGHMLFPYEEEI